MKKSTAAAIALILLVGLAASLLLKAYRVDLIQVIVENAVIQKAPREYPQARIRQKFDADLRAAKRLGHKDAYLDALLRASQRLEKVQLLQANELDALLNELEEAAGVALP